MINESKERHDVFVNVIERVSRDFPDLLSERKIFMKLLALSTTFYLNNLL